MQWKDIETKDVLAAAERIRPYILRTPLVFSPSLSERAGADIYLKLENLQPIGAFKIRGAANMMLQLSEEQKKRGICTFSTGNHGQAVAYVAQKLGIPATICMSDHVPEVKVGNIKRWEPTILQKWKTQDEAMEYCFELESEKGMTIIPPFDHKDIILGQGTMALEIGQDLPEIDTLIAPLSGGGLLTGLALGCRVWAEENKSEAVRIFGVCQQPGAAMVASLKAGRPVEIPEEETLADSLLGGIGLDNRYTFEGVRDLVEEVEQVSEEEIRSAIAFIMEHHKIIIEGAAATGVALAMRGQLANSKKAAIAVTGCGIGMEAVETILRER